MVGSYIRLKSYAAVQREFRDHFPEREPPAKRTIRENVSKYHTFGNSLNLNKGNSGRSTTARTPENIMRVSNVLQNNARNISNNIMSSILFSTLHCLLSASGVCYALEIQYHHVASGGLKTCGICSVLHVCVSSCNLSCDITS